MDYEVIWQPRAIKSLRPIPQDVVKAMNVAGENLAKNPRPDGVVKLRGELEGLWRIRVRGSYRMVYEIDDDNRVVSIVNVGTRGASY